jgi:hypothetical protein
MGNYLEADPLEKAGRFRLQSNNFRPSMVFYASNWLAADVYVRLCSPIAPAGSGWIA